MKITIASDHAGVNLKEKIFSYLKKKGIKVTDLGPFSVDSVDYPDYAKKVSRAILSKKADVGILICGTGLGMSITANRFKGIRAAVCHNVFTAKMARKHNNANILAIGARIVSSALAIKILKTFISTAFEGGRHIRRVKKIEK